MDRFVRVASFAQTLRAKHEAIMVGVGMACRDDPRLSVRLVPGKSHLRVVVDSTLRAPLTAAVLANGAAVGTVVAVTERASVDRCPEATHLGATVLRLPADTEGHVDLEALLAELYASGVRSVLRLLLRGDH